MLTNECWQSAPYSFLHRFYDCQRRDVIQIPSRRRDCPVPQLLGDDPDIDSLGPRPLARIVHPALSGRRIDGAFTDPGEIDLLEEILIARVSANAFQRRIDQQIANQ